MTAHSFPLFPHTIFVTLAGSQAHGTARPGSDVDLRGICIAPRRIRNSIFHSFEQFEGGLQGDLRDSVLPALLASPTLASAADEKIECVVYDVAKFIRLCAAANPNVLEILFTDEGDWLLETPAFRRLYDAREIFLTQRVQQTFLGYALAQLKRIKTHRSWLLAPPEKEPDRSDFGLGPQRSLSRDDQHRIEQALAEKIREYGINDLELEKDTRIALSTRLDRFYMDCLQVSPDELVTRTRALATHALSLPEGVVLALNAEKKYRAAQKHYQSYQSWKRERNPARADLERKHGFDTKHAMHLVRLMRMGVEILKGEGLNTRRPDAAELIRIRDGAWSFEELMERADTLQVEMVAAAKDTALAATADFVAIDELALELMEQSAG